MEKQEQFLFERTLDKNIKLGLTNSYKQGIKINDNDKEDKEDIHILRKFFKNDKNERDNSLMYVFEKNDSIINLNFFPYGSKYCYSVSSQDFKNYFSKCVNDPKELTKFYRSINMTESKELDQISHIK